MGAQKNIHAEIRSQMRNWRQQQPLAQQQAAAQAACQHLSQHPRFQQSQSIGCYIAQEGELDPSAIIKLAHQTGKKVYLPALHSQPQKALRFLRYLAGDRLQTNQHGILEPSPHASSINPWELDLVIFPLVAFDAHGNRLGRGAGYYDRCFSFVFELPNHSHPCLVGYAYAQQQVAALQKNAWDVPMDFITTETQVLRCKP